jgi:ribonucleotide monophosphatase NagD (HAD superfamily)
MVGDDPEADAAGAAKAGLRSILVRTGRSAPPAVPGARADLVLDSIADLA